VGGGFGALPGATVGNRLGWIAGAGAATAGAAWVAFSGRHAEGIDRVNTALGIASEHLGRIAGMPPGDNDPDFIRDMVRHAQKHLNNAGKYLKYVRGRTQERLRREIDEMRQQIDRISGGLQ
jgi:hypothetical protein